MPTGDSDLTQVSNWHRRGARLAGALAAALLAITGCEGRQQNAPLSPATPRVSVTEVVSKSVARTAELTAAIEAVRRVTLRARVEGFLTKRHFTEGDLVAEGDLLYEIDPAQFEADLRQAEGELATNRAALVKAQADLKRYATLVAKGDVSQETYDAALATEREAKADVAASLAAVDQARLNLGYAKVAAPLAGRIGATQVNVGNLVGPNENAELATIVQQDPVYVVFQPGGAEADAIAIAQRKSAVTVSLTLPDSDIEPRQGKIDFIDNQIDQATGRLKMRAVIPNPDGLLLPGRFARVQVDLGSRPDTLLVPQRALVQNQGGFLVYVVGDDGKVQQRQVSVGEVVGHQRVLESGVAAGEQVIVDGVQHVKAGQTVKVEAAGGAPSGAKESAAEATSAGAGTGSGS